MDMFDFFFPEQAEAMHLRRIARNTAARSSAPSVGAQQTNEEIAALRADVGFLSLVLAAILKRLDETQTMSLADVKDIVDEIDALDGVGDGGLDPGVLRGLLGVLRKETGAEEEQQDEFQIDTARYRRYR